jgi:uncharacterized protein YqeY
MLIDQIKQRMFAAIKAGNTVEKEILRTAVGEVTRSGDDPTDERVTQVLRKLLKANQETLGAAANEQQKADLRQEIAILEGFLPESPGPAQLAALLAPVAEQIRAAAGPGPAMGVAMKFLKGAGVAAESRDVQAALNELRKSPS